MRKIWFVYRLFAYVLMPILICMVPVVIAITLNAEWVVWFMLVSVPTGIASCDYFWDKKFDQLFGELP